MEIGGWCASGGVKYEKMKWLRIFLVVILTKQTCLAQFAIVHDKEGFVNIRQSSNLLDNNIVDTLLTGQVVYCFEPEGNWIPIDYFKGKVSLSGYIHKSRIQYISIHEEVPIIKLTPTEVVLHNKSFNVTILSNKFVPSKNKIDYKSYEWGKSIFKINDKEIWGTEGNMPKTEYSSITITAQGKTIKLPKESFENLFEPSIGATQVYYDSKSNRLYITTGNSDGAGAYVVLWIVENGKYKNRIINYPF